MTQDPEVCQVLISPSNSYNRFDIPNSPEIQVLIPGCGSEIYLQKELLYLCPHIKQVYCTDFSETAIATAKKNWKEVDGDFRLNSQQIIFEQLDSTNLTEQKPNWKDKFDYILVVNSVLSGEDWQNRQMIAEFYKILKPGGRLYGFFPTIFCPLEIAHLCRTKAHWLTNGTINLPESALYEYQDGKKDRQLLYTPSRLNQIFKEAGFKRLSFEVFFHDSDISAMKIEKIFDVNDPEIYYWSFLVRFEK